MDDAELHRALNDALSVSPSPGFVARVRIKIAETEAAPIAAAWRTPAAIGASVLAIVVVFALRPDPIQPALRSDFLGSRPIGNVARAPVVEASPLRLSSASDVPRREAAGSGLPEVIISADDVRGFQELVASAQERRFEATFDETPAATPWVTSDLTMAPLSIEPLVAPPAINN